MERQLDLNQSGQVFLDNSGPYTPPECENKDENCEVPTTSDHGKNDQQRDSNQIEVIIDDNSVRVEVEKETIQQSQSNHVKIPAATFKSLKSVEGTHSHLKNSLHHVCTNTPFPNFFEDSVLFVDRTEFMKEKINRLVYSPNYLKLDQIFKIFIDEKINFFVPLRSKFSFPAAKTLFQFDSPQQFFFGCLTPFDCDLLRIAIVSKFQIRPCRCSGTNCFDMSEINAGTLQKEVLTAATDGYIPRVARERDPVTYGLKSLRRIAQKFEQFNPDFSKKLRQSEDEGHSSS